MAFSILKPYTNPIPHGFFETLGRASGEQYTAFIPKEKGNTVSFTFGSIIQINGRCKYAFVYLGTIIVGVLFITPAAETANAGFYLAVADPIAFTTETFTKDSTLEPQGLLILKGNSSSILICNKDVDSPLMVKVE